MWTPPFPFTPNWGRGYERSVYEIVLAEEWKQRGFTTERQLRVPIEYRGLRFEEAFRIDLLVENTVAVELKSVETIKPVHKKQLLTYIRLLKKPLGLLLNSNEDLMKHGITRIVNNLPES